MGGLGGGGRRGKGGGIDGFESSVPAVGYRGPEIKVPVFKEPRAVEDFCLKPAHEGVN